MKTINSISGGMTSSYIAAHYPADYNQFALVRTNDTSCMFPDAKIRQFVSDKIGKEFIGTLENDMIIYTILDLEQFIGQEIHWVSGESFEDIIRKRNALPNIHQRFCTADMKILPMKKFWYDNINQPVETRIGFRANEMRRAKSMIERCNEDGFMYEKFIVGKSDNGRNKWKELKWQKPVFPLIDNVIFKDEIENYWKDKPVRFAWKNNCVGCFHNNCILLKHTSQRDEVKFNWFMNIEKEMRDKAEIKGNKFFTFHSDGMMYEDIKNHKLQLDLFDDDFNECDTGYCGL
jgi:hypothetical protein